MFMSKFTVDRVLRQQNADREAQAAQEQQLISENVKRSQQELLISGNGAAQGDSRGRPGSGILSNWRQKFKPSSPPSRPLQPSNSQSPPPPIQSGPPPPPPANRPNTNGSSRTNDPMRPYTQGPQWNPDQEVTPHANIERNVRAAIEVHFASFCVQDWLDISHLYHVQGCKPERNSVLRSQAHMTRVKEAVNEGYCDTMGALVRFSLSPTTFS